MAVQGRASQGTVIGWHCENHGEMAKQAYYFVSRSHVRVLHFAREPRQPLVEN
jgi:hypothetical protein